jgi:hypothetical protein
MRAPAVIPVQITVAGINPLAGTRRFLRTYRIVLYGLALLAAYLGGPAAWLAALLSMICIPIAFRGGLLRHGLHCLGLGLGLALAAPVGVPLGQLLAGVMGPALGLLLGIGAVIVAPVILSVAVGRRGQVRLRRHRYLFVIDRAAGATLGVGEGVLGTLVLIWLYTMFGSAIHRGVTNLANMQPQLGAVLRLADDVGAALCADETLGAWGREHNLLERVPAIVTSSALAEFAAQREVFWAAYEEGVFDEVREDPAIARHIAAIMANPALRHAVKQHDLSTLLASPELAAALADDECCRAAAKRWPELRARVGEGRINEARKLLEQASPTEREKVRAVEEQAAGYGIELR